MAAKVTFNPATRRIEVTLAPDANGLIVLNVQEDLYSDGKEDWLADATLNKMRFPINAIGGNPLPLGVLGDTYILEEGWKIAPYEADHTLRIVGNLFAAEEPLVVDTVGSYRVRVQEQVSTLVEVVEGSASEALVTAVNDLETEVTSLVSSTDNLTIEIVSLGASVGVTNVDLETLRKVLTNRKITDPDTGTFTIYDDDDTSVYLVANIWEDAAATIPYKGQGLEQQEKLV